MPPDLKNPEHTELHLVDLSSKTDVERFLSDQPLPLPTTYIVDKRTGKLYEAGPGLDLYSLHDPYTGEHTLTSRDLPQTWAGPLGEFVLHSVYWNGSELLCSVGTPLTHKLAKSRTGWSQAVLNKTFT